MSRHMASVANEKTLVLIDPNDNHQLIGNFHHHSTTSSLGDKSLHWKKGMLSGGSVSTLGHQTLVIIFWATGHIGQWKPRLSHGTNKTWHIIYGLWGEGIVKWWILGIAISSFQESGIRSLNPSHRYFLPIPMMCDKVHTRVGACGRGMLGGSWCGKLTWSTGAT